MSSRGQPTVLADRYELGEVVGRGGMAEVRLAHDRRLGRTVAVKIMRADLVDRADFIARFGREARSVAALNHPTVVAVYDSGEARLPRIDGTDVVPYIVMEYVTGRTLDQLIDEGPVPVGQALSVTADVLTALEHAHAAGIVHRDIKPSNVMLTPDGAAKVMDFGIARVLSDATMTTTVVATPHYVSPEHAHGERVDARADLYSVGCMLFELLTGRPPFVGDTSLAVVLQHLNEPPPHPSAVRPGVPPVLDPVVDRALAKERDDRYPTAAQFRDDLEAVARGEEPSAARLGPAGSVPATSTLGPPLPLRSEPSSEAGRAVAPTVAAPADPTLGPTTHQAPYGPGGPRAVPDGWVAPDRTDRSRAVRRWWLVGALVLVAVVACAVWWWPRGGTAAPPLSGPTEVVQDEGSGDRPTEVDQADDDPSDQDTDGADDQADVDPDGATISADELRARLVPPNAGSPGTQEQSVGDQTTTTLTYQSGDTVERLTAYYQNALAGIGAYSGQSADGGWHGSASSGGWTVLVTLTGQGSGTTVVVTLTGTG